MIQKMSKEITKKWNQQIKKRLKNAKKKDISKELKDELNDYEEGILAEYERKNEAEEMEEMENIEWIYNFALPFLRGDLKNKTKKVKYALQKMKEKEYVTIFAFGIAEEFKMKWEWPEVYKALTIALSE